MFITKDPVPVTVDGINTIYVRPRMGFGLRQQALDAMMRVDMGNGGGTTPLTRMQLGSYNLALLCLNIVRWDGPAFQGRPVTPQNIEELDDEALTDAVLAKIQELNQSREDAADPNGGSAGTSAGALPSLTA